MTAPPGGSAEPSSDGIVVLAATGPEARPLRQRLRDVAGVRVEVSGIGLSRWLEGRSSTLVSCGLAGGLDSRLRSGAVVIPDEVGFDDGARHACDPDLVARFRGAAQRRGVVWHSHPLVTVDHVVTGAERALWSDRGYAAVDMESALMVSRSERFAVVRVVLDTPGRELSPAWAHPGRAVARPWLWGEALWLARAVPRLCDLAATIVAEALSPTPTGRGRGTSGPPAPRAG